MKYCYVTCARVPGKKAHCSQIAQMCRAFVEAGMDLRLLHPARSTHGDYKGATIEQWYGFDRSIPATRLFCIDYMGRIPGFMPNRVTSVAYRLMVATYNRALLRYLRRLPGEFGVYSRDPRVMRRVKNEFPNKHAYLELHMLRDRPVSTWEDDLLARMDGIIVVTHKMKEMLSQRGIPGAKVLVEPNGVDQLNFPGTDSMSESRNRLVLPLNRKYISFVGNFRALNVDRGLETVIRAMPAVVERYPEVTFLFVGGPMECARPYIQQLEQMRIDPDHYLFVDRQPYNKIRFWLAASDILVHPVPEHPIYTNITSPLKIFEYMTAGRPIVASNLPSIREVLKHEETALLSNPGEPKEFADSFIRLLGDSALSKRLSEMSKQEVAERTWEARAARIMNWMSLG